MLGRRTVLAAGAAAAMPAWAAPSVRNTRGKIVYFGDDNKERGREWFGFTYRKDGQITLRAYCEMDDIQLERDVVYTMNDKFRPLDCFIRLHQRGAFLGSGWIRVTETMAECEVFNSTSGRLQQRVALATPAVSLGAHPLACDALVLPAFDHSKPERVQTQDGWLTTSPLLYGAAGPMVGVRRGTIEYLGPKRIKVPAGEFETHHYRFPAMPGQLPHRSGTTQSEEIWVTHPDYQFVRAEVWGYLTNESGHGHYELAEFER